MRKWITLSLCFFSLFSFTPPHEVPFFEGPFKEIQAQAEFSQTPFILYVYQNECQACQVMEENVLRDPEILSYIQDNYLATQKNLMTYEGRQLSQWLGSPYPGSLIIFSPQSKVLEHIQEGLGPDEVLALLQYHAGNNPASRPENPLLMAFDETTSPQSWEPSVTTQRPQAPRRIQHSTRRVDPFARESPQHTGSIFSANTPEKQYDWYERTLSDDISSSHSQSYPYGAFRSRKSTVSRDRHSFSEIRHLRCYGKYSLRKKIAQLKERGVRDIQVFPQGKSMKGKPIYILRYRSNSSTPHSAPRVKVYRSSPYRGF